MLKGLLAGGISLGIAAVFPEPLALPFLAVVLGLTVGVGAGIALGNPESGRPVLEWTTAFSFVALGMVGLWVSPLFLAISWGLHALWSLLRRFTALGDGFPEGWFRFCFTFDLVLGGFVAYIWMMGG